MKPISAAEFQLRWPVLRPIDVPVALRDTPGIDLLSGFGLPSRFVIHCYNDIEVKLGLCQPLELIWQRDTDAGYMLGEFMPAFSAYYFLADVSYLQGHAWLCIEQGSGRLIVVDLDASGSAYLCCANVPNFYTILGYFLEHPAEPAEQQALLDSLLAQDGIPAAELEPFWLNVLVATMDGDDEPFYISI